MDRQEVYKCIDEERAHQEAAGMRDERELGKWLASIGYYEYQAWVALDSNDADKALICIRDMTAAAIACMEQYGCPPRKQGGNHNGEFPQE
jgi:hypothetical protein